MHYFRYVLCAVVVGSVLGAANAAEVPPGTVLAEKQEIVRHIKDEPASLDPMKAVGLIEAQVVRDLFEGLVNQDAHGQPIPGVALSWKTADNQTYIFTLRKDAKWSNGEPVTAQDFVYSWRRLVDPKSLSPFAWFAELAGMENAQQIISGQMPPEALGVSAIDHYTLKVKLSKPVPYFPSLTANFSLFPVPQSVIEKYGNNWTKVGNLVGNGAFKLQDRVVNEKLVFVPNEYYWDHGRTVLTKVTFVPISQEANATKRYLAGDIDITESFPKNLYQKLLKDIPDQVYTPDQLGTYYYAFNTQRAPTNDVRVRKALSYAIDRKIIAEKVLGTGEKPAYHFTPDVTAGYEPAASLLQQQSQEELNAQAKSLLHAAGYGPDKPLTLTLLYNTSDNNQKLAIAIASMWKKTLGIDVKMVNQEWKTYIDSRNTGNFDVVRASWIGDYNEPSTFLSLLTSRHSGNIAKFNNADYDRLLADAGKQTNAKALSADYNKAEQIIAEQVPIAPIYQFTNGRLIKSWVKGYPITNPEDVAYSQNLYIIKH
ncbi:MULTISPECIES: peptide ABC transporter substrate-binding protein [Yersinia pseudotuberculosis complex]|uniref:Murein tripeptide ABC transporter, periplasmic murein peptide-binding protein n=1 Tax=Yersinia pseudotuberculosis serotype O:1b (strain IP 31758) TaxID=349747 RepID=A0A0U1R051_YERP3|nr:MULTISPECIES: ABC transporter substrate-binding protein [Yersinia pseudotuberculosis complex]ABS48464.1 murein tripeptide ABC transporter, periplasmic murein peptide-binding protein [Yersinia pseudotuberculosis IP 31758]AJK14917.1 bacterial extracellular solute-binding s, 5 Middle family protein [Yersinia pseudotuberculosis str. PA3606]MCE4110749.1 ABC transporter substrate-binding protein [Yersinia pseudotuberculosis]MCF1162118.1 ABC transporter substrate-binding protein [Yersinia pseudotub